MNRKKAKAVSTKVKGYHRMCRQYKMKFSKNSSTWEVDHAFFTEPLESIPDDLKENEGLLINVIDGSFNPKIKGEDISAAGYIESVNTEDGLIQKMTNMSSHYK